MCRGDHWSPAGVQWTSLYCGGSNLSAGLALWGEKSEIFGLRRMWNNSLRELWNIAPTGRNVKWNLPTFAKRIFHTPQAYFTFRRNISLARKGKFRWKKHLLTQVLFSGWGSWIRTSENARVKVWCLTAWLYPNYLIDLWYYITFYFICQELFFFFS